MHSPAVRSHKAFLNLNVCTLCEALYRLELDSPEFQSQLPLIPSHPLNFDEARLLVSVAFDRNLTDALTRPAIHMVPSLPNIRVRVLTNEAVDGTETINNVVLTIDGAQEPGVRSTVICNLYECDVKSMSVIYSYSTRSLYVYLETNVKHV